MEYSEPKTANADPKIKTNNRSAIRMTDSIKTKNHNIKFCAMNAFHAFIVGSFGFGITYARY